MRDSTAAWLTPILEALDTGGGDTDVANLMMQATMPVAEADDPRVEALAAMRGDLRDEHWSGAVGGLDGVALDWVRFGQLGIAALGWTDSYPWEPPPE